MYESDGCCILHIFVQSCCTALMGVLTEEQNKNTVFEAPDKNQKLKNTD